MFNTVDPAMIQLEKVLQVENCAAIDLAKISSGKFSK